MFSNKFSLLILLFIFSFSFSIAAADNVNKVRTLINPDGSAIVNDVEGYLYEFGTFDVDTSNDILPESQTRNSSRTLRPGVKEYFHFDMQSKSFLNISSSCRKLIYRVTNGRGLDQLYYTAVQPWKTTSYPNIDTVSGTWTTYAAITSVSCNDYAPGIKF